MIRNVSNINFNSKTINLAAIPPVGKLSKAKEGATRYIKIGDQYVPVCASSYQLKKFEKLANKASKDPKIIQARKWQELEDARELEKGYLDLKV